MKNESKIKKLRLQIEEIEFLISFLENDQERKQECQNIDSVNSWEQGPVYKFINAYIKSIAKENSLDIDELSKGMDIFKEPNLIPFHKAAPLMKVGDVFKTKSKAWGNFELYKEIGVPYFRSERIGKITLAPVHFNLMGEIIQSSSGDSEPEKSESKESELMTLQEASEIMKKGDMFQIVNDGARLELYEKSDEKRCYFKSWATSKDVVLSPSHFKMKGRIIPAETKVLGEKEHWKASSFAPNLDNRGYFKLGHKDGKEDGQLKQWLNHKDLRKAVDNVIGHFPDSEEFESKVNYLNNAMKNLKPLNPE